MSQLMPMIYLHSNPCSTSHTTCQGGVNAIFDTFVIHCHKLIIMTAYRLNSQKRQTIHLHNKKSNHLFKSLSQCFPYIHFFVAACRKLSFLFCCPCALGIGLADMGYKSNVSPTLYISALFVPIIIYLFFFTNNQFIYFFYICQHIFVNVIVTYVR